MIVGIVTTKDPSVNKRVWSGTVYKSREAIENAGYSIKYIPIKKDFFIYIYYVLYKIIAFIKRKKSNPLYSIFVSKRYARYLEKQDFSDVDILFVPAMSPYIAFFKTELPIIYLTDSTFSLYCDYYPSMKNLLSKNKKEGLILDSLVYQKASGIICSSDWAFKSIVNDFHIDPSKVCVAEFGPNIDMALKQKVDWKKHSKLNLLFIGVDWKRKGGDVAVSACKALIDMNIDAVLHVVGCEIPSKYKSLKFIKGYGFLSKNIKEDYDKLLSIISDSDLFILPTQAEAAGIVFSEASAFGLPIFTYNTGGVGNYVKDGVNGYKLPIGSSGQDFANKIVDSLPNLFKLKEGCYGYYQSNLNWLVWSKKFDMLIKKCLYEEA